MVHAYGAQFINDRFQVSVQINEVLLYNKNKQTKNKYLIMQCFQIVVKF